jgi:hypothetical protein
VYLWPSVVEGPGQRRPEVGFLATEAIKLGGCSRGSEAKSRAFGGFDEELEMARGRLVCMAA